MLGFLQYKKLLTDLDSIESIRCGSCYCHYLPADEVLWAVVHVLRINGSNTRVHLRAGCIRAREGG